jgi:hypothetical protein
METTRASGSRNATVIFSCSSSACSATVITLMFIVAPNLNLSSLPVAMISSDLADINTLACTRPQGALDSGDTDIVPPVLVRSRGNKISEPVSQLGSRQERVTPLSLERVSQKMKIIE